MEVVMFREIKKILEIAKAKGAADVMASITLQEDDDIKVAVHGIYRGSVLEFSVTQGRGADEALTLTLLKQEAESFDQYPVKHT